MYGLDGKRFGNHDYRKYNNREVVQLIREIIDHRIKPEINMR
jgi:hypothetical protein